MSKLHKKAEARLLRKKGFTFKEIADMLSLSKSTISAWCRDIKLSRTALKRLELHMGDRRLKGCLMGAQANRELREKRVYLAEEWARNMVGRMRERDLLLAGIGLYWGEGAKARKLNFTNSDPKLLVFVKKWFQDILGVSDADFLVRVSINASHKDRYPEVERFWIRTLKLSKSQFYAPSLVQTPHRKVYENRGTYYGVVSLRVRKSTDLQYRILGLIKAITLPT